MPPKLRNQPQPNLMCDRVKDGDKLHKVLESWRMPEVSDTANETGLIKELVFQIYD